MLGLRTSSPPHLSCVMWEYLSTDRKCLDNIIKNNAWELPSHAEICPFRLQLKGHKILQESDLNHIVVLLFISITHCKDMYTVVYIIAALWC